MRLSAAKTLTLSIILAACALGARAAEVVRVAPWEFHSSFWMSAHQALDEEAAGATTRSVTALSPAEQTAWNEAVAVYRKAASDGPFAAPQMLMETEKIREVADDETPPMGRLLGEALAKGAPIYRKHWWAADDKANRFYIGYAAAMVRNAGESLLRSHEAVYGVPMPKRVRVYVTPYAGKYGAYTLSGTGGVYMTLSHRHAANRGLAALETLVRESARAVVDLNKGSLAAAIRTAATKRGIEQPRALWQAIQYATSSELTRLALADRGVPDFPSPGLDLLTQVWPQYRKPLEEHWFRHLRGEATLAEAIDKLVDAVPR
jgi:hypothetical protein